MRMRIVQSLLVWLGLMGAGVLNSEAKALQEITYLSLPAGQQANVERWKDSLRSCVDSGQYAYVCIEANAIDMMYNNRYVLDYPALSNLMEKANHFWPPINNYEDPPCNEKKVYEELLRYTVEYIRAHNQKGNDKVQVVGISFDCYTDYMAFDSRLWHVAQYNQAGLVDSLMKFTANTECDSPQLFRLTILKLDTHRKSLEKSLGKLDYFTWRQFFVRRKSDWGSKKIELHKMQSEDFHLFDRTFKGKKLVIGCSYLKQLLLSEEGK